MAQNRPQRIIDMLTKLIAFDTTSRHSNMALIHFVQDYLNDHGVKSHLVPNDTGDKANLYASIGPDCEGGVVLSGHTDVVPVDGQDWTSDPFRLREADGRLYGRGCADMKGFIAGALALLPEMKKAALKKPIHFAFSYDEELGCRGAPDMIRRIAENLPKPMAVIVGEPTEMGLVNAHKGVAIFKTQITGKAAHSSQTQLGYSAIMAAGEMINKLAEINARLAGTADPNSPFLPNHTTANVNQIKGGAASNILAADCWMDWDIRIMPDDNSDDITDELKSFVEQNLLPKMRKSAPDAAIVTELLSCSPPLKPEKNSAAERLIRDLTGANHADVVSYGTEAGLFQEQGFSTIVCGPGSIAQAHQPDEWIAIDELAKLDRFLNCLIAHLGK